LPNLPDDIRLTNKDFQKIAKNLDKDIFEKGTCSLWKGVLCNKDKPKKGIYINYYFNKKKTTLHRLLYLNFVGSLEDKEYLKFKCPNKGICCNVNCIEKAKVKKNICNIDEKFLVELKVVF
jgi:hypothetical protein